MASEETGFIAETNDGVLTVTFNRPAVGNAIPSAAVPVLTSLFQSAATDPAVRVLLIRGEGKIFSAGGDVRNFHETLAAPPEQRREDYRARLDRVVGLIESFTALDLPIIAACQGAVAGAGMTYALGADIVLADETVNFLFSHQRVGLTPDGGVSALLPRAVGERKAVELVLTAASVKADEALRLGLVSRLVPAESLQDEALKIAHRFAAAPQHVIRRAKRLLHGATQRPLREQMQAERDAIADSVADADFAEGVSAFLEKRAPEFPSARGG
ncbi:enoyl-CoA hydratase/isomerase family protein [Acidocella sp. KAb 2-4]|uniref:enoyl-CoA hydratase/isomerase family protein n=1 Tax=Acidocella sp. KAb 2-4 TaxID=2885158 RepID=UPI001D071617|nr:enoyl-CoA hydratase-related protein [Acidocella sp. KAb 2-4]MCB5945542.1 enoyl-CoA hydratase/isomerase family protein [Acidocella sp. KAb 2-4]